jgi:hypothetical protein
MNTTLEYSTRVVQQGDRRCKKSTLNDLAYLTPLRIPLMNPVYDFAIPSDSLTSDIKIKKEKQLAEGGEERGIGVGEGAKSYDNEKAWSSLNHSILSAV